MRKNEPKGLIFFVLLWFHMDNLSQFGMMMIVFSSSIHFFTEFIFKIPRQSSLSKNSEVMFVRGSLFNLSVEENQFKIKNCPKMFKKELSGVSNCKTGKFLQSVQPVWNSFVCMKFID